MTSAPDSSQLSFPFDESPESRPFEAPKNPRLTEELIAFEYELEQTFLSLQKSYQHLKSEAGL